MAELCGKPLTFGDKEQIETLKRLEEDQEEEELDIKKYLVTYYVEGQIEIEVVAKDKDEAKELAEKELDDLRDDEKLDCCEIDLGTITEVKE